jgi:Tfp pilus assembly protein PilF
MYSIKQLKLYPYNFLTLLAAGILFNTNVQSQTYTTYTTYSQGANYGYGGHYVQPVVTKTYTLNSSGYTSPQSNYNYGSGNSGSSSSYTPSYSSGSSTYLYRSRWERKLEKNKQKELLATQAQELAAKQWYEKAEAVMKQYKEGNFYEAEKIRRSFNSWAPSGVGDIVKFIEYDPNGYRPEDLSGHPFQIKYENKFHYISMMLMGELAQYENVVEYYGIHFTESTYSGKDDAQGHSIYNHKYNHNEQTAKLIQIFKDFTYPEILKLESIYIEALKQDSGKVAAQKYWTAVSNYYVPYIKQKVTDRDEKSRCYNTIAMVQLQLGLTQDALKYFDKQLALSLGDKMLQFTVLQNIIDYSAIARQNDTATLNYCLKGLNSLLESDSIKADKNITYVINYNKAILLMGLNDNRAAYQALNEQSSLPQANDFPHKFLKARLLLNMDSSRQCSDLTNEMVMNMKDLTPLQSAELGNILAEWGMKYAGQYAEAEKEYSSAILFVPDNWSYPLRLAQIYAYQGKDKEAIALLENTILENPDEFPLYIELGNEYMKTGKTKKAKENYLLARAKGAVLNNEAAALIK